MYLTFPCIQSSLRDFSWNEWFPFQCEKKKGADKKKKKKKKFFGDPDSCQTSFCWKQLNFFELGWRAEALGRFAAASATDRSRDGKTIPKNCMYTYYWDFKGRKNESSVCRMTLWLFLFWGPVSCPIGSIQSGTKGQIRDLARNTKVLRCRHHHAQRVRGGGTSVGWHVSGGGGLSLVLTWLMAGERGGIWGIKQRSRCSSNTI